MGSGTRRDLKAAQPWGFLDCTVRERIYLRHEFGLSHLVLPQGYGFQEGIYRQKCCSEGSGDEQEFAFLSFITHMFQLPPRTSANCIVLLIIKAKENPQERQCTGVPHRNSAFYCWNKKSIGCTRKKYFHGDTDGSALYRTSSVLFIDFRCIGLGASWILEELCKLD